MSMVFQIKAAFPQLNRGKTRAPKSAGTDRWWTADHVAVVRFSVPRHPLDDYDSWGLGAAVPRSNHGKNGAAKSPLLDAVVRLSII